MRKLVIPLGQSGRVLGAEPLACVPIVAADIPAMLEQAAAIRAHDLAPDLVELRADHLAPLSPDALTAALHQLRAALGTNMPILFTNRSNAEGGAGRWQEQERLASFDVAAHSGEVALIDIELATPRPADWHILPLMRLQGIGVIFSAHDFTGTPGDTELARHFDELTRHEGAIGKLAVMAQSPDDALRLLRASAQAASASRNPLIAIAMGSAGTITRLAGPFFGSALSYATIGPSSAPGQVPLTLLRDYWRAAGLREK